MKVHEKVISFLVIVAVFTSMFTSIPLSNANAQSSDLSQYLKLWYKFDEGGGTAVLDSSGNGYTGTYENTPSWGTGMSGSSFKMSGGDASVAAPYVKIPNGILNGLNNITISTWVKWTNSQASNQWIYAIGQDSNKYIFATPKGNPGTLYSAITVKSYGSEQGVAAPAVLAANEWHNLAVTISSDTKTSEMYLDGIEVAKNTNVSIKPSDLYDVARDYTGYIGKSFYSGDTYFPGEVDDFQIYSASLTQEQVTSIYNDPAYDSRILENAVNSLSLGDTSVVTNNLTLPTAFLGTEIKWDSSDPNYLANDGTITRPEYGQASKTVTLTATISRNSSSTSKTFKITILPVDTEPYNIDINTTGKGIDINKNLFGLFFEDINYSLDGGLYPELVQNPSFEFLKVTSSTVQTYDGLYSWNKVVTGNGTAAITTANTSGIHKNNPNYLEISTTNPGTGVGVYNTGFSDTTGTPAPSMSIVKNDKYNFSLFLKSNDYQSPVKVLLTSSDGSKVYAETSFSGITSEWKKYSFVFEPNESSTTARLQIMLSGAGTLDVDMVSLFPQRTWKNRAFGVRYDLGKMLDDMKPGFLRFPGGCVVEGAVYNNRYKWKDTVGPREERKNNWNIWYNSNSFPYYNQSYGFGFYEFFQLSEDIGAEPVPCINVGIAHSGIATIEEMGELVQDAVDLADFANSTDMANKWAKLRADMGHPASFNLKYMEIGNENGGSDYFTRYKLISEAVRKAHPEIKLIVDGYSSELLPKMQTGEIDADLVDDHYYISPEAYYGNMNMYNNIDGSVGHIFIGEYASQGNAITNALAEASFMTHIEEIGDKVELASYAPLLAKNNFSAWYPDAIYFTNNSSFGSANYYVQKLFMRNKGDYTLPSILVKNGGDTGSGIHGAIGLASYNTAVQYDDISVVDNDTNQLLFSDDFSGDSSKWTSSAGNWSISNGVYSQTSANTPNTLAYTGNFTSNNYTLTMKAKKTSGSEGFLIHLGQSDTKNFIRWNFGGWGNTKSAIEKCVGGSTGVISQYDSTKFPSVNTNQWYNLKMVVTGSRLQCYVDGNLAFDMVDDQTKGPIYTVTSKDTESGDIIVKAVNPQASPINVQINLKNAGYINPIGLKTVLKGSSSTDANSFQNPNKIIPVTTKISGLSTSNKVSLDPYSFTIFRFRTKEGTAPELSSVKISTSSTNLKAGDTLRINIDEGLMTDGGIADLGDAKITYKSDHPELVTFDDYGKVSIASSLGNINSVTLYTSVEKNGVTVESNKVMLGDNTASGKQFIITSDGILDRTHGGIEATVRITPNPNAITHTGNEAVVLLLMKGNTPVEITGIYRDITSVEEITGYFNKTPQDTSYSVKVYVLDSFNSEISAPLSLADYVALE